jgi:hypothetical protein
MTDTPKHAQARRRFEAAFLESSATLERLCDAFAELERQNHPSRAWAREKLQRAQTAHEVLVNAMLTNDDIDPAELRAFLEQGN